MGIYIEGIKMPKNETYLRIDEKGEVYVYGSYPTELYKAIPVQPHGRLIDADALVNELVHSEFFSMSDYNKFVCLALKAPTIIPAEEGE